MSIRTEKELFKAVRKSIKKTDKLMKNFSDRFNDEHIYPINELMLEAALSYFVGMPWEEWSSIASDAKLDGRFVVDLMYTLLLGYEEGSWRLFCAARAVGNDEYMNMRYPIGVKVEECERG